MLLTFQDFSKNIQGRTLTDSDLEECNPQNVPFVLVKNNNLSNIKLK